MSAKLSPLITVFLASAAFGGLISLLMQDRTLLLESQVRLSRPDESEPAADRSLVLWIIRRDEKSTRYTVEWIERPYDDEVSASLTTFTDLKRIIPALEEIESMLEFADDIKGDEERATVLNELVFVIRNKPLPASVPLPPRAEDPASSRDVELTQHEDDAALQEELKAFVQVTQRELAHAQRRALELDDCPQKAGVLMEIADAYGAMDLRQQSRNAVGEAKLTLVSYYAAKHSRRREWSNYLFWPICLGFGSLVASLFGRAMQQDFVQRLVRMVGKEEFAEALSSALKTIDTRIPLPAGAQYSKSK